MSISSVFGSRIVAVPSPLLSKAASASAGGQLVIESSSRPTKKGTAHHMKTRPRKTQQWDIRRKPTVYDPLPPLPPDWTLVSDIENAVSSSLPQFSHAPPTLEQ